MKFRSKNSDMIRIASTTGDVILIGADWVDVPDYLNGDAYAKGCISEEMFQTIKDSIEADTPEDDSPVVTEDDSPVVTEDDSPVVTGIDFSDSTEIGVKNSMLRTTINAMIDTPESKDFTGQGLPNLNTLSDKCGFTVSKADMVPIWEFIKTERDNAEVK